MIQSYDRTGDLVVNVKDLPKLPYKSEVYGRVFLSELLSNLIQEEVSEVSVGKGSDSYIISVKLLDSKCVSGNSLNILDNIFGSRGSVFFLDGSIRIVYIKSDLKLNML